ncbi:class I SAM-dependent methyltransferase [Marinivivus vitaminiproducens]|uniref:class I SAM-dependent methyltransferase n=1 Tax=Marinivivus vitaminiproducens TaxID=3035935 RepID=UPI00279906D8|nr:class I SAM-dependent methyltransferase [Geminicoccaceae bacterium SCSIO 64248]
MSAFASTVDRYQRYRPPYPEAFFSAVAAALDFMPTHRLLDLGTGPGVLALGFAPFVGWATGVDPEPAMLAAARANAEAAGYPLALIEGKAEQADDSLGRFEVVTIGRALHWMDTDRLRPVLESRTAPDGVILVCRSGTAKDGSNPWIEAYERVRTDWAGPITDRRYPRDLEALVQGTRFSVGRAITVRSDHAVPVDDLCQRMLTFSTTSPAVIGGRALDMLSETREALLPFSENGVIAESVEASAVVVR